MRNVVVNRYVMPLREGGSLPAIVEADDGFKYVLKFRGAGQGVKSLIAELIGGMLAKHLHLRVPEIVFAEVDPAFGRTEPDEEIQDLLKASAGLNIALHYLSCALMYDPAVQQIDSLEASKIVWLDALITNVDRTAKNTNMLMWHRELWLIDHGAALYFHHQWDNWSAHADRAFVPVKDHVLLPAASRLQEASDFARQIVNRELIESITHLIPDEWLVWELYPDAAANRNVYTEYLFKRLRRAEVMLKELVNAREVLV